MSGFVHQWLLLTQLTDAPGNCFHDAAVYEAGCTLLRRWVHMAPGQAVSCLLTGSLCGSKSEATANAALSLSYTLIFFYHKHSLPWSHSFPLSVHTLSTLSHLVFVLHISLPPPLLRQILCSLDLMRHSDHIYLPADTLYICDSVCGYSVPSLYSSFPPYSLSEVSVSDPKAFLGSRTKPHLLFHWLQQSPASTAAGFVPYWLQAEWLERTGKSRWSFLASVFCRYECVCARACMARLTLIETCQISSRYLISIDTATIWYRLTSEPLLIMYLF